MKNKELFLRDPATTRLANDGVAAVNESRTEKEEETLRFELEHFVCEGQYKEGIIRILESYTSHFSSTVQPAAWVSGFYGSGKSHLLKMLRHLWVNTTFASDGATARGLAHLPVEVTDLLKELDNLGRRHGSLHAAAGTLPSGGGESVRLSVLGIILRSLGFPTSYPQARFVLWLKRNGLYDSMTAAIRKEAKTLSAELADLYVSPIIARALLAADPNFASDLKQVRTLLMKQFPLVNDISTHDFIQTIREVLTIDGQIRCTVLVLDEIQLFIGDSTQRSTDVQEAAEAVCKQLDSRVLIIGSGQTALAGSLPLLQRLSGRFTIPVELSDADVETVTRRVVLAKKADKRKAIEDLFKSHAGEIDRQLVGTRIEPRSEDNYTFVDDYPLLPVRRRFWERVLRAVDVPGTSSQLRTQLRVVYDAVKEIAEKPIGTVTPADYLFDAQRANMLQSGVLLREIDETIQNLDDQTSDGKLAKRLCSLIFLIRKLPREPMALDLGVRATPDMLADLLVQDLENDGTRLRKQIPVLLTKLVEQGKLIKLDEEYSLQTRESAEWDREFRNRQTRLNSDLTLLSNNRTALLRETCTKLLAGQKLLQGKSKQPRKFLIHYGQDRPARDGQEIPVWIRDGWGDNDKSVIDDARADGMDGAIIYVHIPKTAAEDLKKAIIDYEAARATLDFKGTPGTNEGREARDAMATRMSGAADARSRIIQEVVNNARVFQGGGNERFELDLIEKVRSAADASLGRLFPQFHHADDQRWSSVLIRAKNGDEAALQHINWQDSAEKHPVCAAILTKIGVGKSGREIRKEFEDSPYGWPRDAIDAALVVLHTTGHLRATYKGQPSAVGQLDQNRIPMTDFRTEHATLSAADRIKLRKLFQVAGLQSTSGEEAAKATEFLLKMSDLAAAAGGEPPLPAAPSQLHLETLRALAGNEQLLAVLQQYKVLEADYKEWQHLADLAHKRKAEWETLQKLAAHAKDLAIPDIVAQIDAIQSERRLLETHNPVQSIRHHLVTLLRKELKEKVDSYTSYYDKAMAFLAKNETWKKLDKKQSSLILANEELDKKPEIQSGDEQALLASLDAVSLANWKIKIQALPQQFSAALVAAAKLLEPKTKSIHLTSQTIRTPEEVQEWLKSVEKQLLDSLKNGPIIIS